MKKGVCAKKGAGKQEGKKPMRLILTRHGRTYENDKGILQGQMNSQLNIEGRRQARKLAERLANEPLSAIYSSDLDRAADTARIIAKKHKGIKPQLLASFREFDFGSISGHHKSSVDWSNLPSDVETPKSVLRRARKTLDYIYRRHEGEAVLLVGHGGINRALITIIHNNPKMTMNDIPGQHNTAVNIFEIREDKRHKIHLLNCTEHLSEKKYLKKNPLKKAKKGADL